MTQKETILVIDDNRDNLRLLADILTNQGYQVRPAIDSELALQGAIADPPDLILLDIMMPKLDGYQICSQLKAHPTTNQIPVIFISALDLVFDKVKAFGLGGIDYITKPFHQEEVIARIKTHLSIRSLQTTLSLQLEELNKSKLQLVQAEKMAALGSLIAGIAHEINTPLGVSLTIASTLDNNTKEFQQNLANNNNRLTKSALLNYIDKISRSSKLLLDNLNRLTELVENFQQLAVTRTYIQKKEILIKQHIEQTLTTLTPNIASTHHQIKIEGDHNIKIETYPGALSQVIHNLVINSIMHAYQPHQAGELYFKYQIQNNRLNLIYQDNGSGITPENLSQIFEPFFTTARNRGGNGLGLHIVYNLVFHRLNGTIHCQSELGKGTTMIINLPLSLT